jgi:ferritin
MCKPQWQIDMENAAEQAARNAGETTEPVFADLADEASQLQGIFDQLKLNDEATYNSLIDIVDEATRNNESIAKVIDRVRNLGQAGIRLIDTVEKISSGGALAALRTALKPKV